MVIICYMEFWALCDNIKIVAMAMLFSKARSKRVRQRSTIPRHKIRFEMLVYEIELYSLVDNELSRSIKTDLSTQQGLGSVEIFF